jgi:NitT/TauT family transport system permease protein
MRTLYQRLLAILAFLVVWEVAVRAGFLEPTPVPPASSVLMALKDLLATREYSENTFASLQRMSLGYALATLTAVPLGFLIGWWSTVERWLVPLLSIFRQIPLIALFPIFILFFGLGEIPCVIILMLAAWWSILLNVINGVQSIDPMLVKTARSFRASQWHVLTRVVFPATIPSIITGMRAAYSEVVLILIPVETLGVDAGWGIGVGSHEHHGVNHILMYAMLISMALAGVVIDYILVSLEKELCKWKEKIESVPKPVLI